MDKIKIAHCMSGLDGGVGKVIMNYMDNMPKLDYQIDVITQDLVSELYFEQYKSRDFQVHLVPSKSESLVRNLKELYSIMKKGHYDIVHAHMTLTNFFPLFIAMVCGVKVRVSHSHLAGIHTLKSRILACLSRLVATDYLACGENAGKFLYGNEKFVVINNAIDLDKFKYNPQKRIEERRRYNVSEDEKIIGHIGRFTDQKNHVFMLEVFEELHKRNRKTRLLLIGDGELMKQIKDCVERKGLGQSVIFTGSLDDVSEKLQIMDMFLLPSQHEGLCLATIEAQANGLPCLLSDRISTETKVNENVDFCSLNDDVRHWADVCVGKLMEPRVEMSMILESKFNIKNEAQKLDRFYKDKIEDK